MLECDQEKGGFRWPEEVTRQRESSISSGKVEVHVSHGSTIGEAARKIGVTDETYYRWRKRIGWHED